MDDKKPLAGAVRATALNHPSFRERMRRGEEYATEEIIKRSLRWQRVSGLEKLYWRSKRLCTYLRTPKGIDSDPAVKETLQNLCEAALRAVEDGDGE